MTRPRRGILVIAAMAALGFATVVPAKNAQQEKMATCNAQAKAKSLAGTERREFMKSCLSASDAHTHAMTRQQEKMKSCNADAKAKDLKGSARKEFMRSCLKGS
jgi:hypothetical protein